MAIDGETTAALEHGAEARLAEVRVADTPATGAADALREHRARLKQRDDFREWVAHGWTLTNEIGLSIVESPARRRYRNHHANHQGNRHENRADYWLLFWLWPRDCAPLPRAGLERDRHHANAARRPSAPVGTAPRAGARRDEAREHRGRARGEWAHRRARQQRRHRALRRLRGHADGHGARGVRDQHLRRDGDDAGGAARNSAREGRA